MDIFDELDDESTPSAGQEIGDALSTAVQSINQSNQHLAMMLSTAINQALQSVESKQINITSPENKPVTEWVFKVTRDAKGMMTTITATAGKNAHGR